MSTATSLPNEALGQGLRTTDWSTIRRVVQTNHSGSGPAMNTVCGLYWKPLYRFARRKGYTTEEAQDLTQGFFAIVLQKRYLHSADQRRGRFRTFILSAFQNFIRNSWAHSQREKRGGRVQFVSLDLDVAENGVTQDQPGTEPATALFDKEWAFSLLESVLNSLRTEFTKAGKASHFTVLEPFLADAGDSLRYPEAARALNLSEPAVRVAVHRLRNRYGRLLRQAVAATVIDQTEVDDELMYLASVLSS